MKQIIGNEIQRLPKQRRTEVPPKIIEPKKVDHTRVPHPSMVWPQKITDIPRNIAAEIPVFHVIAYDLFFVTVIGVLSAFTPLINWIFIVYGIFTILLRASSQRMFSSAIMCLIIIPIATILKSTDIANTFAVMTFYFLLIGLIVALLELRNKS